LINPATFAQKDDQLQTITWSKINLVLNSP
jgi:hypothetical protein